MVPTFLRKRPRRDFSSRFLISVIVCLAMVSLSLAAMVFIITSRSLSKEHKLTLLSLLMVIMMMGLGVLERMKT